jgi:Ca-activated chloride channel homolog
MKKISVPLFLSAFLCLSFTLGLAQSRRVTPPTEGEKANKRPAQTLPTPTPTPEETVAETSSNQPQDGSLDAIDDGEIIKVDTQLVTIPVKVSDRKNRFIGNLKKEDFKVFEDNIEQEIALFSGEEQPFTVALVLDMSFSAKFKAEEIQSAAISFIDQLRKNDKVLVVAFDEEVHLLCEATSDREQIYRAIKSTKIDYGTSLYEAVDLVINDRLRKIDGRKAVVLFTDGVDTTSRKAHDLSNLSDAQELDALIYPIRYDTFADVQAMKNKPIIVKQPLPGQIPGGNKSPFPFPIPTQTVGTADSKGTTPEEYQKADEYLNEMANRTGGRLYYASTITDLTKSFANIASELREFYSIGYYPNSDAKVGKKRKIKVKVNQQNIAVRARDSYVVGGEKDKKVKK